MFLGQFEINSPSLKLVFKNMMKLPKRSEGNFFIFLKTNEGYLSQTALKRMQLMVNYTLLLLKFLTLRPFHQLSEASDQ